MEEHGGMMTSDGSRRRTPGGIFFKLAYRIGRPKPGRHLPLRTKPQKPAEEAKKPDEQKAKAKNTQVSKKASKKPVPQLVATKKQSKR